jgi:hypothetical protein
MSIRTPSSRTRSSSSRVIAVAAQIFSLVTVVAPPSRAQPRASDDLAEYRERFKTGLAKYKAGAVAEALQYWEPIYRELGATRGYRLAFNLARAYDGFGDFTRAAERYESFVSEGEARRAAKEKVEPLIEKEVKEARARLAELAASKGRIRVNAGERPVAVRIDAAEPRVSGFVAYVGPGAHVLVLGGGSERTDRREIHVKAGEIVEVTPASFPPTPLPGGDGGARTPSVTTTPPSRFRLEKRVEHPFSPVVLYLATGLTVASVVLPVLTYASALSYQRSHTLSGDADPASQTRNASLQSDYDSHAATYHATLAVPITLAAITIGLTAYYFVGTHQREVPVIVPTVSPAPARDGAVVGVTTRF